MSSDSLHCWQFGSATPGICMRYPASFVFPSLNRVMMPSSHMFLQYYVKLLSSLLFLTNVSVLSFPSIPTWIDTHTMVTYMFCFASLSNCKHSGYCNIAYLAIYRA